MKKLSLVIFMLGTLFLTACSKSGGNSTPATTANCSTNGVYNPQGSYYPYQSQYPYGQPGQTGCAGIPGGYNPALAGQYGLGGAYGQSDPCKAYGPTWSLTNYMGSYVCIGY
jgi:hypothetical protein